MRTRSETRRAAILKAAAEVFTEVGFSRASMEDIRLHVGCSKPTLYSYFSSKEELFLAVLLEATESEFQATHAALDPTLDDIRQALLNFGIRLLTLLYVSQVQTVRQLVISEAGRSDLGKKCYEIGPHRSQLVVSEFLCNAMTKQKLRPADPHIAALHLMGLLESEWIYRFMFQTLKTPSDADISATADRAVSVFMAAYGPGSESGMSSKN
jgi:AcrR family transcriptional regulator